MKQHRRMCAECPLRHNALVGWLGGHSPEHWHHLIHSGGEVGCHMAVNKLADDNVPDDVIQKIAPLCVGVTRYRKTVSKSPPTQKAEDVLQLVKDVPDGPLIEPMRFYEHHSRKTRLGRTPLPSRKPKWKPKFPKPDTFMKFFAGELD